MCVGGSIEGGKIEAKSVLHAGVYYITTAKLKSVLYTVFCALSYSLIVPYTSFPRLQLHSFLVGCGGWLCARARLAALFVIVIAPMALRTPLRSFAPGLDATTSVARTGATSSAASAASAGATSSSEELSKSGGPSCMEDRCCQRLPRHS